MTYQILVTTCKKSLWTMKPFAYLFNIYWSSDQHVNVLAEGDHVTELPPNYEFHNVHINGEPDWPLEKWSNGLIAYLEKINDSHVLILLDDYWFVRTVDIAGIDTIHEYMEGNPNILRVDLTTDRLYAGGVQNHSMYGHYDFVSAPGSQYESSLMPGLWHRQRLLEMLKKEWSPWEVELAGTATVHEHPEWIVLGTRQYPIRMVNSLRNKKSDINVNNIVEAHRKHIKKWFPPDMPITDFDWPFFGQIKAAEEIVGDAKDD